MKIDHIVVNIDRKYQKDQGEIQTIRDASLPYEPSWGKGTRGFKASNLWIGDEYLEMICLLKKDGGGWKEDWVQHYNNGHRGPICLMLDVHDLDQIYQEMLDRRIPLTKPEYLQFKWGFGLFTRTMPWRNSYFPYFEGVPLQIGLQQMKDEKSRDFMKQYMVPNSRENGINGIQAIQIKGPFTNSDFNLIQQIFEETTVENNRIIVTLKQNQSLVFEKAKEYTMDIFTNGNIEKNNEVKIENLTIKI